MATIATQLCAKAETLKNGILQLNEELKKTNAEIETYQQTHELELASLKARHEQELAQLMAQREDCAVAIENNKAFISTIENLFKV